LKSCFKFSFCQLLLEKIYIFNRMSFIALALSVTSVIWQRKILKRSMEDFNRINTNIEVFITP